METGEFHNRDGWYFKRLEDGSVRIRKTMSPHVDSAAESEHVIPPNEWASIVAHVSGGGEQAQTFQHALDFHNDPVEAFEARRSGVTVEGLRVWKAANPEQYAEK